MSVRRTIADVDLEGLNVTQFCRQHGISTWFFYETRRRFTAEGEAGLEPRSRAPKRVANRLDDDTRDLIVRVRKELEDKALDAGPATVQFHLAALMGTEAVPSEATIWRVLSARGFIAAQPHKAPRHAHRSFTADRANECWQLDSTQWALVDGTPVVIINVLDDCTRVAVRSKAASTCTAALTWDALCEGAALWGWPARTLSDNAKAFRGGPGGGGGIEPNLAALGVGSGHSRPYHPQTCGKVERFHQTEKKFLGGHRPAGTIEELQEVVDRFIAIYNHERPHRAIRRRTPAAVWQETPRSGPASSPLGTPTSVTTRPVRQGRIALGHRHLITIGAAYNGRTATAVVTGVNAHVFVEGRLVRSLTLDPTQRNQPLYAQGGRPPRTVRDDSRHP